MMRSSEEVVKRIGTSKAEVIKGWKPCSRLRRSCWTSSSIRFLFMSGWRESRAEREGEAINLTVDLHSFPSPMTTICR